MASAHRPGEPHLPARLHYPTRQTESHFDEITSELIEGKRFAFNLRFISQPRRCQSLKSEERKDSYLAPILRVRIAARAADKLLLRASDSLVAVAIVAEQEQVLPWFESHASPPGLLGVSFGPTTEAGAGRAVMPSCHHLKQPALEPPRRLQTQFTSN